MSFTKILIVALTLCILPGIYASEHKQRLIADTELGHLLDKLYYDAGTKVDIVIFDLNELKRQGKAVPEDLFNSARKADKKLRNNWLKLDRTRISIWKSYSRADAQSIKTAEAKLTALKTAISNYGKQATALAAKINRNTSTIRKGLVYKFAPESEKLWRGNFIRALDLSYKIYGVDRFKYPGNYMNMEYTAKACHDLGLNLLSLNVSQEHQDKMLEVFNRYSGTPFLLWGSDKFFDDKDCISYKYYGNREKLKKDIFRYIAKYRNYRFFAGIQLDEPVISDRHKRYGKLLEVKGIQEAYAEYLGSRKVWLKKNGIKISPKPFPAKPKTPDQQVLYIEWQMFKKQFMADHYKWLFAMMLEQDKFASTVIMNKNRSIPQDCSYVSMGRVLPYLGTDLYNNGTAMESFAMQLLKNSASKRAIMWPGAGYSCKSPDAFKRTMATGLIHADGIHMWTYKYCSKYRDANSFWRFGGSRPNFDDRRRLARQNWYPWAWQIMKDSYKLAADAAKYLGNRKSLAQTAVMVSERTLIANRLNRGMLRNYWENNLGIYCALLNAGIPADVCFIESMSPEKIDKYKVIIASDMRTITQSEIEQLKSWVKNGGTLISTGEITLCDEWGRKRSNYALAKLLGVDFKGLAQEGLNCSVENINLEYPGFEKYALVKPSKRAQVKNWQNGKPALVINRYGHGLSYYFTAKNLGCRIRTAYNSCGFMNKMFPGFDRLICKIIKSKTRLPIIVGGSPAGIEVQIQQSGNNRYIVNLLDWYDNRQLSGHWLQIAIPGRWRVIYPGTARIDKIESGKKYKLRKFSVYDMIVIEKIL
jgi:Beta-galactosidase trimerisation domain